MATETRQHTDPNAQVTIVIAVIGAIAVMLAVIVLQGVYYRSLERENQKKVIAEAPEKLTRLRADQNAKLEGYDWVDSKKEIARIPIDRAMEIVVRDMKEKKP